MATGITVTTLVIAAQITWLWVPQLVYLFDGNDNGTHSGGFIFLTIRAILHLHFADRAGLHFDVGGYAYLQ